MANRENTFLLKRSNVPGKIPSPGDIRLGEVALNTADVILYASGTTANSILPIGWDRISRTGDTVTGDYNIFGDVRISGSSLPSGYAFAVTGDTTFSGDVYVGGNLYYDGNVLITGSTIIQSGLTANTIYTDYIDFNTGATVTQSQGRIHWDAGTGTLNVTVGDAGTGLIDLQVGQEEIVRVWNDEATTLQKGEVVYVSGSQGNRPKVKRASGVGDGYSVTTLGMVDRAIAPGVEGYVTTFGIISNLNTNSYTGGTPLYLSPTTPGAYTSTKPIAPQHTVFLGYVVRQHPSTGSIFVNISNGWELDEIHDVRISGATTGDLLVRGSYGATPVWVNSKTLKGNYTISGNTSFIGSLSAKTTTNVNKFSGNTSTDLVRITQAGSGNAFVVEDTTTPDSLPFVINNAGSVGVGSSSPGAKLDVRAQGTTASDIAFRVRNSGDTQNLVSFHGDGRFLIGQNASNTCTGGFPQYAIAIGFGAIVNGQSENYSSPIAIGYDAQSVGLNSIAIGNSTRPNTGIAIGHGVQSRAEGVAIGGSTTNSRGTVMGSGSSNSGYGGSSIGYDVDNTGDGSFLIGYFHSNSIASSFVWGSNGIKFWVNSNSNLVLANNKAITDANKSTYVNTSATNTITIHSGTAPTTSPADAFQLYSADRGGAAGKASAYFRAEDGTINVFGDRTGINISSPQARLHVANADKTLTTALISGSGVNTLTVIGSGTSTSAPIFKVQGSSGELFSITDSLTGSLFSVNDISGLPILEVFSDNTILMGSYTAPSLNTTAKVTANIGVTTVYSMAKTGYTGSFFDYTVSDGTNLRAGNIMSVWSGSTIRFTETQTTDIGNTNNIKFIMSATTNNILLRASAATNSWTVKTIVRSI